MKPTAALIALMLGLAAPPLALAQTAPTAMPDKTEDMAKAATDIQAIARLAASSNVLELETSTLALERSQDADIRAFAQKMIDDHTLAGEKMQTAAQTAGVEVTVEMNADDQKAVQALRDATDFDRAYLDLQVKAHDEAVSLFEAFSSQGEVGPLRDFATETLSTLKDHQGHVRSLTGA